MAAHSRVVRSERVGRRLVGPWVARPPRALSLRTPAPYRVPGGRGVRRSTATYMGPRLLVAATHRHCVASGVGPWRGPTLAYITGYTPSPFGDPGLLAAGGGSMASAGRGHVVPCPPVGGFAMRGDRLPPGLRRHSCAAASSLALPAPPPSAGSRTGAPECSTRSTLELTLHRPYCPTDCGR